MPGSGGDSGAALSANKLLLRLFLNETFSGFEDGPHVFSGEDFVPLRSSDGDCDGGVVSGEDRMRLVLVCLLAKGMDLLCSPVSFLFRAGAFVAGGGSVARLLLLSGSDSSWGGLFLGVSVFLLGFARAVLQFTQERERLGC